MASALIGRNLDLQLVVDLVKTTKGGTGSALFLRGEPGIGKSRLMAEALAQAELLGCLVLQGRADELRQGIPYAPLREALAPALEAEHDPGVGPLVTEISRALGLVPAATGGDAQVSGMQMMSIYRAAEELLRRWSERRPVVLAVDDLHDADRDTLMALNLLARSITGFRCMVLASYRAHASAVDLRVDATVERLADEGLATIHDLEPLDHDDVQALAASLLAAPLDDRLGDVVWQSSLGNPFFVEESVRALKEAEIIAESEGRWWLTGGDRPKLAVSRKSAMLHRVFRLGRHPRAVARVLTTLQSIRLARLPLVAEITGLTLDQVERAFDVLVRGNVVREGGNGDYEFAHPIVRETLYRDLGPAERRRVHATIAADILSAAGGTLDERTVLELATHLSESADPGDEMAIARLLEAGDISSRVAPQSAARWYGRAVELLPPDAPRRGDLLSRYARALYMAWDLDRCAAAGVEAVGLLEAGEQRGRVGAIAVAALTALGRFEEALDVANLVVDETSSPPNARMLSQRGALLVCLERLDEAEADGMRSLELAEDDRPAAVMALGHLAAVTFAQGRHRESVDLLDRQLETATDVSDSSRLIALATRGIYLPLAGWVPAGKEALAEATELCDRLGGRSFRANLELAEVIVDWMTGRWQQADAGAKRALLRPEPEGSATFLDVVRAARIQMLADRGEYAKARQAIPDLAAVFQGGRGVVAWAVAAVDAGLGKLDEARVLLEVALDEDRKFGRLGNIHLLLSRLARVEMSAGNKRRASELVGELEAAADAQGSPWAEVLALQTKGVVDGDVGATARSLELATAHELALEAAISQLELGALGEDPGTHLLAAYHAFRQIGAEPWRQRAGAEMRSRHIEVPRQRREKGQVTETEFQVARLVGEGLTNKQIASVLFLSQKTVELYLSRVYSKTGYSNRLELGLAVRAGKLVSPTPTAEL